MAGAVLGDPVSGMWVGVLLELLTLQQLPVGAARVWDPGPAAVVGAATAVTAPGAGAPAILLGLGAACLVGWAGGWSVHVLRHLNAGLVGELGDGYVTVGSMARRHLFAMSLDFLRAAALTAAGLSIGSLAARAFDAGAGAGASAALGYLLAAAAAVGLAGGMRVLVMGRPAWIAFVAGGLLGLGVSLWLA